MTLDIESPLPVSGLGAVAVGDEAVFRPGLAVMAGLTESLPVGFVPEQFLVATMGDDVVDYRCRGQPSLLAAANAERGAARRICLPSASVLCSLCGEQRGVAYRACAGADAACSTFRRSGWDSRDGGTVSGVCRAWKRLLSFGYNIIITNQTGKNNGFYWLISLRLRFFVQPVRLCRASDRPIAHAWTSPRQSLPTCFRRDTATPTACGIPERAGNQSGFGVGVAGRRMPAPLR